MLNKLPPISIITVVYNCKDSILLTIESVYSLNYPNVEYIIVDGQSSDGTTEIIKRTIKPDTIFICEHDNGIYDAMNKGLKISTGEWVIFMNAGDKFVENNVLLNIFQQRSYPDNVGIIYGDCILEFPGNRTLVKSFINMRLEDNHSNFCHQSLFAKGELARKFLFNTNYRIIADYIMVDKILKSGYSSYYINILISFYDMSGISSKRELALFREKSSYLGKKRNLLFVLIYIKYWFKSLLFSLFGEKNMSIMIYNKLK